MARHPFLALSRRRAGLALIILALAAGGLAAAMAGCSAGKKPPVVVIGLDGATWDLLAPWVRDGELPHLKAFLDQAAVGDLTTVYPILSPVCWTSAVTGVNPGKHGIYDFQKQDPAGGDPLIETATNRRAAPIWMLLSDAGYKVGVMNVPMTYPPDPVRGEMISGFPFPSGDVNFTYPPELQDKLDGYPLDYLGLQMFTRTPQKMYSDFLDGQKARGDLAEKWVRSGKYDFLWVVFTGPDKVQHFFWKFMDPDHPGYTQAGHREFGTAILDLWKKQDEILGRMLDALPPDATVLMLSDHGFAPIYRQMNLANWVEKTDIPDWLAQHAIPSMTITNGIMHYIVQGGIPGTSDREAFLDKFIEECEAMKDPATGLCPFESLLRREDIYHGPMLEKAPDLVIQESPHYYVTRGVPDSTDLPIFQDVWTTSFSAHHRPQGIVAVRSPHVHKNTSGTLSERLAGGGDFKDAHIIDVTPTLLALMNQTIPDAMDGRVMNEVIDSGFLKQHPPKVKPVEGFLFDRAAPVKLSPEDKERMRALPYLQ